MYTPIIEASALEYGPDECEPALQYVVSNRNISDLYAHIMSEDEIEMKENGFVSESVYLLLLFY